MFMKSLTILSISSLLWPFRTSGAPFGAVFIQQAEIYLPKELSV
jgi:hypothetical protein